MAKTIYNTDSSDLSTVEETITEVTSSTLQDEQTLFHYTNSTEVSVDVVITGSHGGDDDFSDGIELTSESLAAGSSGYYVLAEPWEQVQVSLTPSTAPTSGSLTVYKTVDN